jgi:hypothetical protein
MSNIYIISSAKHNLGPVKIGISDNPENRLKSLQTGFPEKLEIKYLEVLDERKKARKFEGLLHKDISHLRSHGEWFNLDVAAAILHVQFTIIHYDTTTLTEL